MTLLVVLHIFICVFLVFVILLQPGKGDAGIGFGSSSQSIFGSKGASNFLTKTTSVCAVLFILTSFVLTRSRILEYTGSVIKGESANAASKPAAPAPIKQSAPGTAPTGATSTTPQPVNPLVPSVPSTPESKAADKKK